MDVKKKRRIVVDNYDPGNSVDDDDLDTYAVVWWFLQRSREQNATPSTRKPRFADLYPQYHWKNSAFAHCYLNQASVFWSSPTHMQQARLRFRMPLAKALELSSKLETSGLLSRWGKPDAVGREGPPVFLLVLTALTILGRNAVIDSLFESTYLNPETIRCFFRDFLEAVDTLLYNEYIRAPQTQEEIDNVTEQFTKVGFPGALGSVDGVHIWLHNPSSSLKNYFKGKEKVTTRAYLVVADHTRKILHVSDGFAGSANDKQMANRDKFIQDFRHGKYGAVEYTLKKANGLEVHHQGAYLISDNGFQKWPIFVMPYKQPPTPAASMWTKWTESVRKDIECTFGILKKRFMILDSGIRFADIATADKIFRVCCILHNMLHELDDMGNWNEEVRVVPGANVAVAGRLHGHHFAYDEEHEDDMEDHNVTENNDLTLALVEHFNYLKVHGQLVWTRRGSAAQ